MRNVGRFLVLLAAPFVFGESDNALAASRRATPVATQQSTWNHNGSVVSLVARGEKQRIVYQTPRVGLIDAGVKPGMVLFEGHRKQLSFSGTAYMFYRTCKPQSYAVTGDINESASQITLKGKAPLLDVNCTNTGSRDDLLIFTAIQPTPGEPPKSDQIAAAPSTTAPAKTPVLSEAGKAANASAAPVVNAAGEKRGAAATEGAADAAGAAKKKADETTEAAGSASASKDLPPAEPAKVAASTEPKMDKTDALSGPPAKDEKHQAGNAAQLAALPQDNANAGTPAATKEAAPPAAGPPKDPPKTETGTDKSGNAEKEKAQPAAGESAPPAAPTEIKTAAIPPPAEAKTEEAGNSKNTTAEKPPAGTATASAKTTAGPADGKISPLMTGQEKMMEIVLKNGRILRVGRDMDIEALARLIAMLERQ